MKRPLDTTLVLAGWDALEPDGDVLASRVLAALDAPARTAAPSRRWPIAACALAVAGLLAPLWFVPHAASSSNASGAPIVAHGPDLDLGQQTD